MSERPARVQRRRIKGWRMPEGAVYVGRPSKWANPFVFGPGFFAQTRADAVVQYRRLFVPVSGHVASRDMIAACEMIVKELRGKNLCCWCPLDQPCHADVLLEIANG